MDDVEFETATSQEYRTIDDVEFETVQTKEGNLPLQDPWVEGGGFGLSGDCHAPELHFEDPRRSRVCTSPLGWRAFGWRSCGRSSSRGGSARKESNGVGAKDEAPRSQSIVV